MVPSAREMGRSVVLAGWWTVRAWVFMGQRSQDLGYNRGKRGLIDEHSSSTFSCPCAGWSRSAGVGGVYGDGGSPAVEPEPLVQQAPAAAKPATTPQKGAGQEAGEAQVTTPARSIDTKQLSEVVKEEVKGGESSEGPTPFDHLWQPSKTDLIKDEPLAVTVPLGLQPLTPKIYVPAANPITKGKYELGRQLYFEPRVSLNGTVSCATCHNPAKGWTDKMPVSIGISGQTGGRSAPSVLNTVYGKTMFWDGRCPVARRTMRRVRLKTRSRWDEQSYKEIVDRLRKIPGYTEQFKKVFGTDVTLDGMAKAIATFERVAALSGNSKYDKYNIAGDNKAMSESEKRGMVLFGLLPNTDDDEFKAKFKLTGFARRRSARSATPASTSPTSSSTTWESAGTRRPANSPTWAVGHRSHRCQVRCRPGGFQDPDGSRRRTHGPVHARRQPGDARSRLSIITTRVESPTRRLIPI